MRVYLLPILLIGIVSFVAAQAPKPTTHVTPLDGHNFTLPVGFTIERVAGPPLVDRPITADFDEDGRLYVSDSSGSNEKVQDQLEKKPHRIVRLEDKDGDGKFDKRIIFADKMMFPEGTMWYAGSLYVAAPPSIWKLTDTDGDGVADQRVEWFQGKTLTGCANDLHGPYLGPDGWIYWCKGAFARQTYELPLPASGRGFGGGVRPDLTPPAPLPEAGRGEKKDWSTRAAHIFRARPDGTGIEPVMTGGMDNPVDVVFMPNGERIFTTTFLQHPGGGKRDGLIHALYGGVYGKDHDVIHEHPWTGPQLLPPLVHLGAAAPAGLCRYESTSFGDDYKDNLFTACFNMQKVTRHVLTPQGATYKADTTDFLVSDNKDFHPTDVLEDADGSLLVVDTGGWYKLCCPTSQLHKPDVLGAIYRVRKIGAARIADPRGTKLRWDELGSVRLAVLLADPRPVVRRRALAALAAKGSEGLLVLQSFFLTGSRISTDAKRAALWAAIRVGNLPAPGPDKFSPRRLLFWGLHDKDETVRHVAILGFGQWREPANAHHLRRILREDTPHNRRAAAEALGRIGDKAAVPALLDAHAATDVDDALQHSLIYALIEIGDKEGPTLGLTNANPAVRRAALIALDQLKALDTPEHVAKELSSPDIALKDAASWIILRHPEWGGALVGELAESFLTKADDPKTRDELIRQAARFAKSAKVQSLLAEKLRTGKESATKSQQLVALRAMAQASLKAIPEGWLAGVLAMLAEPDHDVRREAILALRAFPLPKLPPAEVGMTLMTVANAGDAPVELRLRALAAVPGAIAEMSAPLFELTIKYIDAAQPVPLRSSAAETLSKSKLNANQLIALAEALKNIGPMELARVLEPFVHSSDASVGSALLKGIKESPARTALRVEQLRPKFAKYGPEIQKQAEELYAALDADLAQQKTKLEKLLAALEPGDVRRGQAVFNGTKAACASCHAIGYLGGNIGPDLTHIGRIRTERDLLESIVFPNASFVQSYEPVVVLTKDGKVHNGLVKKDAADELLLATGANEFIRLAREEIEDLKPSKVSIMPAGLDQQLTPRELADLVAFLKGCK